MPDFTPLVGDDVAVGGLEHSRELIRTALELRWLSGSGLVTGSVRRTLLRPNNQRIFRAVLARRFGALRKIAADGARLGSCICTVLRHTSVHTGEMQRVCPGVLASQTFPDIDWWGCRCRLAAWTAS